MPRQTLRASSGLDHLRFHHTFITIRFAIFQMEKATADLLVALETCETFRVKLLTNGRHNCLLVAIKHNRIYQMVFS